jgi:hypothetical protein
LLLNPAFASCSCFAVMSAVLTVDQIGEGQ